MRRSRAFVLSELLMTMLLQAGFILILCTSFYLLTSFYAKTQQVLTARNHAERVIQFMDDKIKNAGLGLWKCNNPEVIRDRLTRDPKHLTRLNTIKSSGVEKGYNFPVALSKFSDGVDSIPLASDAQREGDVLTLLYTQRDASSNGSEVVLTFRQDTPFNPTDGSASVRLIDISTDGTNAFNNNSEFKNDTPVKWSASESIGIPFYISSIIHPVINISFYGANSNPLPSNIDIPNAGELMYMKCIQMFVRGENGIGEGRQLAFREMLSKGEWNSKTYNQEKGILEIYMTLDHDKNIFTLYVLASGGKDATVSNQRPAIWPSNANWDSDEYPHHVLYVARKSWKLNNIHPNFNWN